MCAAKPNVQPGITEVQFWVPANTGPVYLAADAIAPNGVAAVTFDPSSTATSNGAVMSAASSSAEVAFSGLYSPSGGGVSLTLTYRNSGSESVNLDVRVNQILVGAVSLDVTASDYSSVSLQDVQLWRGTNFVNFVGGADGVHLESVEVVS